MAALVLSGVIGTGVLSFLRTGHTHEDIDALLSELAKWVVKRLHDALMVSRRSR